MKILLLAILCLSSLAQTYAQELNQTGLHRQIPANLLRHSDSATRQQLVEDENKKHVRFVYLVPSDKAERPEYKLSIANAAKHLQLWYKMQLGNNRSFNLTEPIVEVYKSSHDTNWYSTNPDADWAGEWKFWFNAVNDAFTLSGGRFNDPDNFWIIYVDALPACPMQQGGGLSGVAAMGANDLRGLVGQSWIPICNEVIPAYSPCRYVGGLGHELGHAFGLPHPPGCDDGQPVACDYSSIMFTGYIDYPNTYFSINEKTVLNSSPFINEVSIKECNIDCTNLTKQYSFSASIDVSICEGENYFAGGTLQTTAGTYQDIFTSKLGCDSVVVTRLNVSPTYERTVNASICQGKTYFAGGGLQTAPGTYHDIFSSKLGCDSVVVTRLSVLPKYEKTVDVSICQGKSYFAGGTLQTTAGTYRDTFTSKLGCDSVIVTRLSVSSKYEKTVDVSICQGKTYFAGGALRTTGGTYRDTFTSKPGCDSVVVTRLSVLPNYEKTVDVSICQGKSYYAGGALQTTAGSYRDAFASKLGCDSVIVTRLSVSPKYEKTIDVSICQGKTYFAGGALQKTAGTYRDTFKSKLGCDSVIVTRVSVSPKYEKTVDVSICQGNSYFVGGALQTTTGSYRDTFTSKHGCDSIIVTRLAIVSAFEKTITVSICQGESNFVGGSLQTTAGIYTDISKSTQGCDSIVITNLEILPLYEKTVEASICEGETYFAGGDLRSEPGIYYDTLSSVQGCDTVIVTQLRRGICTGVPAAIETSIKIYPVPTNGILYIEYDRLHREELFNSIGQHVLSSQMNYIDFSNLAPGYYYLKIYFSEDEFVSKKIIFTP